MLPPVDSFTYVVYFFTEQYYTKATYLIATQAGVSHVDNVGWVLFLFRSCYYWQLLFSLAVFGSCSLRPEGMITARDCLTLFVGLLLRGYLLSVRGSVWFFFLLGLVGSAESATAWACTFPPPPLSLNVCCRWFFLLSSIADQQRAASYQLTYNPICCATTEGHLRRSTPMMNDWYILTIGPLNILIAILLQVVEQTKWMYKCWRLFWLPVFLNFYYLSMLIIFFVSVDIHGTHKFFPSQLLRFLRFCHNSSHSFAPSLRLYASLVVYSIFFGPSGPMCSRQLYWWRSCGSI